ncbi:MAG: hypothetical protein ACJ75H_25245 [Thermoanaerobaculia bacterium]
MKKNLGVALLAAGLTVGQAAAADLWLHLKVDGRGDQVSMNLPISMVRNLTSMIPEDSYRSGRVRVHDKDYSVAELRRAWRDLQNGPDATFLSVDDADSKVRIAKRGDYLEMRVLDRGGNGEDGETVEAKVPLSVMAALLSGSGDELNVNAALDELARFGAGELMTVTGKDETVRIWISDRSEER